MSKRQYDVIVWGATGFTGKWVAKHLFDCYELAANNKKKGQAGKTLCWAIAGRNPEKLSEVRDFIGDIDSQIDGLLADANDLTSLQELVACTKVIISTVGPYACYGSNLVQACADAGTDYVDLTGEVPWMRSMIDDYQQAAQDSGARIVHSCGFDSIPSDMGVYFIQSQAQAKWGIYLNSVRYSLTKVKGGISGGTIASMLNIIKQAAKDKGVRQLLANPYSLNPDHAFKGPDKHDQMGVKFSKELDKWTAPFLMASINTRIVRRSNALMGFSYGENFSYNETMPTSKGVLGYAAALTISNTIKGMAFLGLTSLGRKALSLFLPSQGAGPKVDPNNPGFYIIHFHGTSIVGKKIIARVQGDADPGYGSTSKMLAESAVCLALDKPTTKGGFWTPSSAMGNALLKRLENNAGLTFTLDDHAE